MTSSISPQTSPYQSGVVTSHKTQRDTKRDTDDSATSFGTICDEIRTDASSPEGPIRKQGSVLSSKSPAKAKKQSDSLSSALAPFNPLSSNSALTRTYQLTLSCGAVEAVGRVSQIASATPSAGVADRQHWDDGLETPSSKTILFKEANPVVEFTVAGQRTSKDAKDGVANYITALSRAVIKTLKGEPECDALPASAGAKTPLRETDSPYQRRMGDLPWYGSDTPCVALVNAGIAQTISQGAELASNIPFDTNAAEGASFVSDNAGKTLPSNSVPERQVIIDLEPETIGPLKIRMTLNCVGISVQIDVASSDALLSLRASHESLRNAIENTGGKVNSLSVKLGGILSAGSDRMWPEPSSADPQINFLGSGPNSEAFAGHGGSANGSRNETIPQVKQNDEVDEHFTPLNKRHFDGYYL